MQKTLRLRSQNDFHLLFKQGRRHDSPLFRILIRKTTIASAPRFAFIISRSVEKRAVLRNRLRRRVREWVRRNIARFPSSTDTAFVFKKAALQASRTTIYEELDKKTSNI